MYRYIFGKIIGFILYFVELVLLQCKVVFYSLFRLNMIAILSKQLPVSEDGSKMKLKYCASCKTSVLFTNIFFVQERPL